MSKPLTPEQKAERKAAADAKKAALGDSGSAAAAPTSVTVAFEGGEQRTYEGKDALAKAKEFISKRPNDRSIVS